jgi:hypothetical protein
MDDGDMNAAEEGFRQLAARTDHLHNHVGRMAINHGLYTQLNEAMKQAMPVNAKKALDHLRNVCLMSNLIGLYSVFSDRRPDDIGFNQFNIYINNSENQTLIVDKARDWIAESRYREVNVRSVSKKIS